MGAPGVLPPPPPAPSVWRVQLGALATLSLGLAPGTFGDALRPGLALRVTPRGTRLDVPVEVAVDAPGSFEDTPRVARVTALPVALGAGLCPRFGRGVVVSPCAIAGLAAVVAWGRGYGNDATDVAFGVSLGARVGVEVPLRGRWSLVASLEGAGLLVRPALTVAGVGDGPVWTASPFRASLALGVAWTNR